MVKLHICPEQNSVLALLFCHVAITDSRREVNCIAHAHPFLWAHVSRHRLGPVDAQPSCCDLSSMRFKQYNRNIRCPVASQDEDFAIAKALQEQERAFMALQRFMHRDARSFVPLLDNLHPTKRCCGKRPLQASIQRLMVSVCGSCKPKRSSMPAGACPDASMVCREDRRALHGGAEAESEEGPDDAGDKEGSADLSGAHSPSASSLPQFLLLLLTQHATLAQGGPRHRSCPFTDSSLHNTVASAFQALLSIHEYA